MKGRRRQGAMTSAVGLVLLLSCQSCEERGGDAERDERFLDDGGRADGFGVDVTERSPIALGVLWLVNDADEALLTADVGVSVRSARSIVESRVGPDGILATRDDREVTSLAALDEIPYVGVRTFEALVRHALDHGYVVDGPLRVDAPDRVVAIGDLHGDLEATRQALQIAGAIDELDRWVGGNLVVVQTGDFLDRGDDELAIMRLLERLTLEAAEVGGALITLLGNHEIMNVAGDFGYVTERGFADYEELEELDLDDPWVEAYPPDERARAAAFLQGGPAARQLALSRVVVIVNDTLFVHAGALPEHVEYGLDAINFEARAWMLWDDLEIPALLDADDGPVWYRGYGDDVELDCTVLGEALALARVGRMVVGHTVQESGITAACDEQLFRIDVGMSAYYEGAVEVLEITSEGVWTLSPR